MIIGWGPPWLDFTTNIEWWIQGFFHNIYLQTGLNAEMGHLENSFFHFEPNFKAVITCFKAHWHIFKAEKYTVFTIRSGKLNYRNVSCIFILKKNGGFFFFLYSSNKSLKAHLSMMQSKWKMLRACTEEISSCCTLEGQMKCKMKA